MTEAEFEKNLSADGVEEEITADDGSAAGALTASASDSEPTQRTSRSSRSSKSRAAKPRRIQRMFAIEEDLDRKLWLYAIHMGKDRSEIINDLLRPLVTSMVVYDGRDRRSSSSSSAASMAESA